MRFGFGIDPYEFLAKAFNSIPKLNSIDGRMVMQDLYETEYGIYDHISQRSPKPLASVAMHSSEDINEGSLLEEAIRTYTVRGVKDLYGLNLLEFLELPIDVIEMMFSIAEEEQSRKAKGLSEIEAEFAKK